MNALLPMAAFVVVVAGLRAAKQLILPFLFALVLAVLVLPAVRFLERNRVPRGIAVAFSVFGVFGILVGVGTVLGQIAQQFSTALPRYQEALSDDYAAAMAWLAEKGVEPSLMDPGGWFDPGDAMVYVGTSLNSALDILSNTLLVALTMAFILAEAAGIPDKWRRAFGETSNQAAQWGALAGKVQRYLALKTIISALTGLLLGTFVALLGLDFPVLWGLLVFALNFVPTIGSIIAAIPPVLLALIQLGPGYALGVGVGFLAVNLSIGNLLEPRIMGDQLGLSPMIVFLSLVFWGWLWGPMGMLLSVPLTVVMRNVLDHRDDTRWLAVLLGPNRDAAIRG